MLHLAYFYRMRWTVGICERQSKKRDCWHLHHTIVLAGGVLGCSQLHATVFSYSTRYICLQKDMNIHNMMNQNWTVRRSIPSTGKLFLYPKATWPVLGLTQFSVAWVSRVLPAGSSSRFEIDHLSPSNAEVESKWCHTSTPPVFSLRRSVWTCIRWICPITDCHKARFSFLCFMFDSQHTNVISAAHKRKRKFYWDSAFSRFCISLFEREMNTKQTVDSTPV
jgi:hypothetical protein